MSNIDEIIDRLIKGGRGSGRRGHKTPLAPVSDIKREIDPEKRKKLLSSDKRAAKKEVKGHTPEELQSKIDSHKELSESEHLSPASRESYAAKHKALVAHQKKQMKNKPAEAPAPEGIASRPGPFGNINKGGVGSGKKGHTTQKHLEQLKGQMGSAHIMQHGDKGSAFSTAHRQGKSEVFHHPATDSYHVVTDGKGAKHLSSHEDFKALGAPYKGDPAAEAVSPTSHGTKPAGEGKYGVEGGKYTDPASEGASAAMSDNRRANTEKYLEQLKTSLSLETDPAAKADFEKDIKDIEAELKIKKSLDTLFYMNQLANQGRIKPKNKRNVRKSLGERLEKKQGVPKGVDPAKHERCVLDVKADGKDKSSAYAICNASMNKGGPGSGKKSSGKIEPKHFEPNPNLRDKNKDLDRISPEESKKRKENLKRILEERRKKINKAAEVRVPSSTPPPAGEGGDDWWAESVTDKTPEQPAASPSMHKGGPGSGKKGSAQDVADYVGFSDEEFDKKHDHHEKMRNKHPQEAQRDWHGQQYTKMVGVKAKRDAMKKAEESLEKFLAGAALKTGTRVVQNLVKPGSSKGGEKADDVPGSPDGPSVAAGGGTGNTSNSPGKKMTKSIGERLMTKGGIGSGRKGHHTFTDDGYEHDSVFEDSRFDNTQEREIFNDKMKAAAEREERKAEQRLREKGSTAKRGISRKAPKAPEKKSFLQRLGQGIIDRI